MLPMKDRNKREKRKTKENETKKMASGWAKEGEGTRGKEHTMCSLQVEGNTRIPMMSIFLYGRIIMEKKIRGRNEDMRGV